MTKTNVKNLTFAGMFSAIIVVLAQIAIPLPINVPVTLQTFAIALAGYFLGCKYGTLSVLVYVLLGSVGVPVFANFKGGFSVITGYTGGFIYGFIAMGFLCGLGTSLNKNGAVKIVISTLLGVVGLMVDHLLGAVQYATISDISLWKSICVVSLPFFIKDIVSVVAAYLISEELVKRLAKHGMKARQAT